MSSTMLWHYARSDRKWFESSMHPSIGYHTMLAQVHFNVANPHVRVDDLSPCYHQGMAILVAKMQSVIEW